MDIVLVSFEGRNEEIMELVDSIGFRVLKEFQQKRSKGDPRFFVGRGKMEEVKEFVKENEVDIVVFDGELSASQHYHLESAIGIRCTDRIGMILDLFATRAHTKESKLQVELARIEYELPLLREWISKRKVDERPGFLAGGEYRVDTYYEHARKRKKRMNQELKKIAKERELRRELRRESGFVLVSIVGYANAGKSSLLNALSGEDILVEDRLFSTLSTTTRRFQDSKKKILLTDTVGFIENLPVRLIEPFRSTLEEVFLSDIILLLLDGSDPTEDFERKLTVALNILLPETQPDNIIPVINKIDLISAKETVIKEDIIQGSDLHHGASSISIKEDNGLHDLVERVYRLSLPPLSLKIKVPMEDGISSLLSWLHENSVVESVSYGETVRITLRCDEATVKNITEKVDHLGGNTDIDAI
ncbi:MAG: GTPase HflX [Methanomassiliicoccales archaeon]|nr:MAG: GTPase HflX [Methanomassiliicoccales archaeon]